jgi:hypothetical protein
VIHEKAHGAESSKAALSNIGRENDELFILWNVTCEISSSAQRGL